MKTTRLRPLHPSAVLLLSVITHLAFGVSTPALGQMADSDHERAQTDSEEKPATPAANTTSDDQAADDTTPSDEIVAPVLEYFHSAQYPPDALEAGLEAAVVLAITIDIEGHVSDAQVLTPVGHGFDEAALEAVEQFRFTPAKAGDTPIPVRIRFTYRFAFEEEPAPAPEGEQAQEGDGLAVLTGKILEQGSNNPLADVSILLTPSDVEISTDEDGLFRTELPPGNYRLLISSPFHEPLELEEELEQGVETSLEFHLEPISTSPFRAVVRERRIKKVVTRTTLEAAELVRVPGTFGEPFRVVETLPGVARSPYVSSLVMVRGAAPYDTGFMMDGHNMPLLYHFLAGPAVFNAELIGSIDFYPGGWPVQYGRHQAGLIESKTTSKKADDARLVLNADMLNAGFLAQVPTETGQVSVAARRSHYDLIIPLLTDVAALPQYWDYQALGTFDLEGGGSARILAYGSSDSFLVHESDDKDNERVMDDRLDLGMQFHRLQGKVELPVQLGPFDGSRVGVSAMTGYDTAKFVLGENNIYETVYNADLRADLSVPVRSSLTLLGGVDLVWRRFRVDLSFPYPPMPYEFPVPGFDITNRPRFDLQVQRDVLAPALWMALEWRLWDRLYFYPGVRADRYHYGEFSQNTVSPRLTTRIRLSDDLWLKGAVGIHNQPPDPISASKEVGNPNITCPYAVQSSVGSEFALGEHVEMDLTLFYNSYRDLLTSQFRSEGDQSVSTVANDGQGRAYGMEFLTRYRPGGRFMGWLAYTLSKAERRWPWFDDWTLYQFDQPHILSAVASYDLGRDWTLGGRFRLVSGNPIRPIIGSVYDADRDRYTPIRADELSDRMPAFHQLDIRLDKRITFRRTALEFYLDIQNVYNAANSEFIQYNYDYSRWAPVSGIPFLPSLGVKGEFLPFKRHEESSKSQGPSKPEADHMMQDVENRPLEPALHGGGR